MESPFPSPDPEPVGGADEAPRDASPAVRPAAGGPPGGRRARALLEVILCSGLPAQAVVGQVLALAGWPAIARDGTLRLGPLLAMALIDTCLVLLVIAVLLRAGGERLGTLLVGARPVSREAALGLLLVPVLFVLVGLTVLGIRHLFPWTHNVAQNPFEAFLKTQTSAGIFAVVAIVAGGLREEVQRAFMLHRFEQHLGGAAFGLVVLSLAFGAGHVMQGWDVSIATAVLGFTWGWIYLRRRSAVAPIVSHAGYNAAQILQATLAAPGLRI